MNELIELRRMNGCNEMNHQKCIILGLSTDFGGWAIDYSAKDSWWGYLVALNNEKTLLKS